MAKKEKLFFSCFDRFTLELTEDTARTGSHQGQCDNDIEAIRRYDPGVESQLKALDPQKVKGELKGYGAWDDSQLEDEEENLNRVLWIACGNIVEELNNQERV
jgi:hypothetical protein